MPTAKRTLSQASLASFVGAERPVLRKHKENEIDEDSDLKAALAASLAQIQPNTVCPLCGEAFPADIIQRHASRCGEATADDDVAPTPAPPSVSIKDIPKKSPQTATRSNDAEHATKRTDIERNNEQTAQPTDLTSKDDLFLGMSDDLYSDQVDDMLAMKREQDPDESLSGEPTRIKAESSHHINESHSGMRSLAFSDSQLGTCANSEDWATNPSPDSKVKTEFNQSSGKCDPDSTAHNAFEVKEESVGLENPYMETKQSPSASLKTESGLSSDSQPASKPSFFSKLLAKKPSEAPITLKSRNARGGIRKVPFYKILEGMPISVDAFSFGAIEGCIAYVLTHFHADHYGGLTGKWDAGPIYCSPATARLVCTKLGVKKEYVNVLPMHEPTLLPGTGVTVTLIDANHCPGACIMVFEGHQTTRPDAPMRTYRYLHCGDFRACPQQLMHPALQRGVDIVYLDTTYLNPRYCFPAQPEVINACVDLVLNTKNGEVVSKRQGILSWAFASRKPSDDPSDLLVVVGTYSIGKERLVLALAQALHTSIYCIDQRKYQIYAQLQDPELNSLLTRDPTQARVHVTNLFALSPSTLRAWADKLRSQGMPISQTMAFRPTGWTHRGTDRGISPDVPLASQVARMVPNSFHRSELNTTRDSTEDTQVYGVPYSEHSSFYELTAFMTSLPHHRIIPTVNVGSETSRNKMRRWTNVWTRAAQRRPEQPPLIEARSKMYW
ncbi:DNA cross-link repair protein PSO2/SNM1 [Malassezia yamatoensis]|uniref:DNA cross-link repair protein PSO2/SNM1 n=1 Tax=Malassezia yamatoensis TaxID=253288 RepID=A0AAJ5YUQ3_9BASI|nr:DNA cross-link repair protein PSO2/SNM1 [Malassezia yamatoensis]